MIFKECFVLLLLAHIISDFYLQSVGMEDRKSVKTRVNQTLCYLLDSDDYAFIICNVI